MTDVDISGVQNGYGILATASIIFSWPGISKTISKKMLDFTKSKIDRHDERAYFHYLAANLFHDFFIGDFFPPDSRLDSLANRMIKGGELAYGVLSILFQGY